VNVLSDTEIDDSRYVEGEEAIAQEADALEEGTIKLLKCYRLTSDHREAFR
jgi:hypothetical protein